MDMVSIRLTQAERFVVVGTPGIFKAQGRPVRPEDLHGFRCILHRTDASGADHWRFVVRGRPVTIAVTGPLLINDVDSCIRAALRGVGLFRLPRSLVMPYLDSGALETVLDAFGEDVPGLSLYHPSRSQALPKLRAFIEFAVTRMRHPVGATDYLPTAAD